MLEDLLPVDKSSPVPFQDQIFKLILNAISNGYFVVGQRMPSTRVLADHLGVSRSTVSAAYEALTDEGVFECRSRSGFFVSAEAKVLQSGLLKKTYSPSIGKQEIAAKQDPGDLPKYDFMTKVNEEFRFPIHNWRRAVTTAFSQKNMALWQSDFSSQEDKLLTDHIRGAVLSRRQIWTPPELLVVTTIGLHSVLIMARYCAQEGLRVGFETPHFPHYRSTMEHFCGALEQIEIDQEGAVPPEGPGSFDIAVITANFQFPSGRCMSGRRKQAWLDWASRHNKFIIELDFYGELNFSGSPRLPIKSQDAEDRVFYISSFSFLFGFEIGTGYMLSPAHAVESIRKLRNLTSGPHASVTGKIIAHYLSRGFYPLDIARLQKSLVARRIALQEALDRHFPASYPSGLTPGGSSIWIDTGSNRPLSAYSKALDDAGLMIWDGRDWAFDERFNRYALLSYRSIDSGRIHEGVRTLWEILRGM